MKVLVTGANGFVGQSLCPVLLAARHEVIAAIRHDIAPELPAAVKCINVGSLTLGTYWRDALDGVDAIVHLAARAHVMEEISDNPELFSLYGTRFGGDGRTTFGLPDLRGRSAMARGQGPGRDPVSIGQVGGREYAGILPQHSHSLLASPQSAELPAPSMAMLPSGDSSSPNRYSLTGPTSGTQLHPDVIQPAGNANAGTRLYQPVIALQYCIVTRGAYPPRTTQGDPE